MNGIPSGAVRVFVVRDRDGAPWGNPPGRIGLAPPGACPVLPFGGRAREIGNRHRRDRVPRLSRADAERLTDWVAGWENFAQRGVPLECTRAIVVLMLQTVPWFRRQVESEVAQLQQLGIA